MDLDTAYQVMMGFAGRLRLPAAMQKVAENTWTVHVQPPGQPEIVIHDLEAGRAMYAKLAGAPKARA
jgi:hypothetical protein